MKFIQKTSRGQVWYIRDAGSASRIADPNDHVVAKNRPWVVVSCEDNNINSPTVNCVPLSTGFDKLPMHVCFTYDNRPQRILCEQIRTFNVQDLKEYQYTLTRDIMSLVDQALVGQLGLTLSVPSYDSLISLVEKIAEFKSKEIKDKYQKVTDEAIFEIACRIESMFAVDNPSDKDAKDLADKVNVPKPQVTLKKAQELTPSIPTISKVEEVPQKSPKKEKDIPVIEDKSQRTKWTPELVEQFLKDVDILSLDAMVKKYNLKDKKAVYSYKYYLSNRR